MDEGGEVAFVSKDNSAGALRRRRQTTTSNRIYPASLPQRVSTLPGGWVTREKNHLEMNALLRLLFGLVAVVHLLCVQAVRLTRHNSGLRTLRQGVGTGDTKSTETCTIERRTCRDL